jgi:hypothetical protein
MVRIASRDRPNTRSWWPMVATLAGLPQIACPRAYSYCYPAGGSSGCRGPPRPAERRGLPGKKGGICHPSAHDSQESRKKEGPVARFFLDIEIPIPGGRVSTRGRAGAGAANLTWSTKARIGHAGCRIRNLGHQASKAYDFVAFKFLQRFPQFPKLK